MLQSREESIKEEVEELLKKHSPSQLDQQLQTTCPFFVQDNGITSVYGTIHDIAKSRILTKLQIKLNDLSFKGEVDLKYGRVDGGASKIVLTGGNGEYIAFIEVKTGNVKLVQPAAYTYLTNTKTLIVELKPGDVSIIDCQTAERILREVITHVDDKERLREADQKLPGAECRYCRAECEHREVTGFVGKPLKNLPVVLDNLDTVTDKLVAIIEDLVKSSSSSL